jgi:hypothetical protein
MCFIDSKEREKGREMEMERDAINNTQVCSCLIPFVSSVQFHLPAQSLVFHDLRSETKHARERGRGKTSESNLSTCHLRTLIDMARARNAGCCWEMRRRRVGATTRRAASMESVCTKRG